jgi:eukaryotic-like serine/threonine-protein kinase
VRRTHGLGFLRIIAPVGVNATAEGDGEDAPRPAEDASLPGPKLLAYAGESSEDPTLAETPPVPSVRRSSMPPTLPPMQRISLPPQAMQTGRLTGAASAVGSLGRRSTSHTVVEALHSEEAARVSAFGRAVAVLCLVGFAAQPLAPDSALRLPLCGSLVVLLGFGVWAHLRGRDEATYTSRVFEIFGTACALVAPFIVYYCGVFSPAPLLMTLGMFFFGQGDGGRYTIFMSAVSTLLYLGFALGVGAGILPDAGLFRLVAVDGNARLFMTMYVPSVLAVTLWQARQSRKATLDAIERATEASRLAAQREAQLDEAHIILEHALRAGAGIGGRYSGRLVSKYRLAEVIGRGAMGEIYAASNVDTDERAAVKLLSTAGLENPALVERFLREGALALRLDAPIVVRILDVGAADDGAPFIAMELLVGSDLAFLLRQKKQLEPKDVSVLVQQIARGLEAAHDAGIVHRDLKPQNLFRTEPVEGQPTWKILDFGVSKLQGSSGTLTQHAVVGTPGYMSPEQAQGAEADTRSDLFALGAVAYRALTGRPPFAGSDTPQILFEIVYKTPARASEIATGLPRDVDLVLAIAMAKRPEDRFSSATELGDAFALACRGKLPQVVRERGRAIVAKYPWGKPIGVAEARGAKKKKG